MSSVCVILVAFCELESEYEFCLRNTGSVL